MTEPVRIYWDVDGVINTYDPRFPVNNSERRKFWYADMRERTGWNDWFNVKVSSGYNKYLIVTATDRLRAMAEVSALEGVEPVWLTTWQRQAPDSLSGRIRLPEGYSWRVLEWDMGGGVVSRGDAHKAHNPYWKVEALLADTEDYEGKVVWVDDDLPRFAFSDRFKEVTERLGDRLLFVTPATNVGLTREEIHGIIEFITPRE